MTRSALCLWLGAIGFALVATGCEQPNWKSATYVNKRLVDGSSTDRQIALEKIGQVDFSDKELKKMAPGLAKTYLEETAIRDRAMQYLVQAPSSKAKKAYLTEIQEQNTDYTASAAEALGEIEARDTLPKLLELYSSSGDNDLNLAIIRGLDNMPDPKMVDPLTKTLYSNVDNNPIALHSYSCEILGKLAQKNPGALDDKAKRALVYAQFLSNNKGQSIGKECGLAVQKLGDPAIPLLIETFKLKNKDVQQWFLKYNSAPKYQFPKNRAKITAARRLTTLRADRATDLFLEEMNEEKKAPPQLPGKHKISWRKKEGQALHELIFGLGELGAKKTREPLEEALTGEYKEKWTNITDWSITLQLRQDAAFALVRLGARDATDALMEMARDGVIVDLERRASILEKRGKPMKTTKRYQFNWMSAKAFAFLATGDQMSELKSLVEDTEEKKLRKKYESFVPAIELAETCRAKGKPAAQAKCYGKKLTADDSVVRHKAAWELNRLPTKAAGPVIVDKLADTPLDVREVLTLALYRHPYEKAIKAIDKVLKKESDETGPAYSRDHHRLKLLRAWLKNQFT